MGDEWEKPKFPNRVNAGVYAVSSNKVGGTGKGAAQPVRGFNGRNLHWSVLKLYTGLC